MRTFLREFDERVNEGEQPASPDEMPTRTDAATD